MGGAKRVFDSLASVQNDTIEGTKVPVKFNYGIQRIYFSKFKCLKK